MKSQPEQLNFHGEDVPPSPPELALFHVIPAPYEQSVSYGKGTADGPRAILEASCQLETLACGVVPSEQGIYTTPFVDCSGSCEAALERIAEKVSHTVAGRSIPVLLGGEHTVTCGAIAALQNQHADFGVIQFDAHADLRASYEGSAFSHACVMRRIHEQNIPILQLGTRSYSIEEDEYRKKHQIPFQDSEEIWRNGPVLKLPADFPKYVYLTFDVDALDSSILPATGTPVPGGLNWYQAMWLVEKIMNSRVCIGFDVVELAPIDSLHACTFTAAQLTYNMMAYLLKSGLNRQHWLA